MNMRSIALDKRFNLITALAAAAFGMYLVKKLMVRDFKDGLSNFSLVNKCRDVPLYYIDADGTETFTSNLEDLTNKLGTMQIKEKGTNAANTFYSAKRVAALGWVDQYTLRCAEFLVTRSLEQFLAETYKSTKTIGPLIQRMQSNKKLMNYLVTIFGNGIGEVVECLKNERDFFAHKDDYSKLQQAFNYRLFLLVAEIINYQGFYK